MSKTNEKETLTEKLIKRIYGISLVPLDFHNGEADQMGIRSYCPLYLVMQSIPLVSNTRKLSLAGYSFRGVWHSMMVAPLCGLKKTGGHHS